MANWCRNLPNSRASYTSDSDFDFRFSKDDYSSMAARFKSFSLVSKIIDHVKCTSLQVQMSNKQIPCGFRRNPFPGAYVEQSKKKATIDSTQPSYRLKSKECFFWGLKCKQITTKQRTSPPPLAPVGVRLLHQNFTVPPEPSPLPSGPYCSLPVSNRVLTGRNELGNKYWGRLYGFKFWKFEMVKVRNDLF